MTLALARDSATFRELTGFIWSVADLLRGDYKQADYGKVILPLTVLRRLDCVLEPTKAQVLERAAQLQGTASALREEALKRVAGQPFYNISRFDFQRLKGAPNDIAVNLRNYIDGFSGAARDILERFRFDQQIAKLDEANLLYLVVRRFAEIDLHPERVPNEMMGSIFEELIRRFSEASNETAGEHFTPREVIRLMVNLLLTEDDDALQRPGAVRTLYDPAAGTGGMLSVAQDWVRDHNPQARLEVFGQELNDESYAICKADMLLKGQNPENIARGNSFSEDGHAGRTFDYMLSNPPFGVDWKKVQKVVEDEHKKLGHAGRFGAGTPRINDGSLLFLQHMISKMKREGSRLAIVFNGSPLFSGDAGSGESEIRRWILENDWLEAIVALPDQLFYNTGIHTYIWVLTNRKSARRRGKVQLINAVDLFRKMKKSLGNKRNEMGSDHIEEITGIHGDFAEGPRSKVFDNEDFGYRKITVERPLRLNFQASLERMERLAEARAFQGLVTSKRKGERGEQEIEEGRRLQERIVAALRSLDPQTVYRSRPEFKRALKRALDGAGLSLPAPLQKAILSALAERDETAEVCTGKGGAPEPNPDLRDTENVPLKEDVFEYFEREVRPFLPDAWIDEGRTKIGYEVPFTRFFYAAAPSRPLVKIEEEISALEAQIASMLDAKREAVVYESVTRAASTDVPMKDSGIPWIGAIPVHWTVAPIRFVARLETGHTPSRQHPDYWVPEECTIPWFTLADVWQIRDGRQEYLGETAERVSPIGLANSAARLLPTGTVVLSRTASVGFSGIMPVPMATSQDFVNWICGPEIRPLFLLYVFRAMREEFRRLTMGSTHQTIYMPDVRSFRTPLPPLEEQDAIVAAIRSELARHDELIDHLHAQIEKLREYRQTFISTAVTGQLTVQEEVTA